MMPYYSLLRTHRLSNPLVHLSLVTFCLSELSDKRLLFYLNLEDGPTCREASSSKLLTLLFQDTWDRSDIVFIV